MPGDIEDVIDEAVEVVEQEVAEVLGTLRRERDEYLDMVRRVQADFENFKKRTQRQQTDHVERAAEDLVTKMLPVLDAFDLARAHLGGGDDAGAEGKALLSASSLLFDTLAKEGLERIDDPGALFDPTMHEAVDRVEDTAGVSDHDGPVVDGVLRAGYRWKGRVIRPAMVRVRG
ncbi:MAG: nucleotide exchange factor GrpE [Acidimicrobiales bacterium]